MNFRNRLYDLAIRPHSQSIDVRRREFVLNSLLVGLLMLASAAVLLSVASYVVFRAGSQIGYIAYTASFWIIVFGLLGISRKGHSAVSATVLLLFLLGSGVQLTLSWGVSLAVAQLVLALTILATAVLLRAPYALAFCVVVIGCMIGVSYLQTSGVLVPDTSWRENDFKLVDSIGYVIIFIAIGFVSWLSNLETDRSLRRARKSEAALQKERDTLELRVAERTRQLEELQLSRLLELQPFAEFGRIGAGLVHEIANPLTAANLQLEELDRQQHSALVRQVQRNLNQLERYLLAARKQLKRESRLKTFTVGPELRQVSHLLAHKARKVDVKLEVARTSNVRLYGDVVKFNQLVANLLANAIDASEASKRPDKVVTLTAIDDGDGVVISVHDFGIGIRPADMETLFQPFFSTKKTLRTGLGIGLAMVKQYVEVDFRGLITVSSTKAEGTTFTVRLRSQHKA